jgi:hypothetical protein
VLSEQVRVVVSDEADSASRDARVAPSLFSTIAVDNSVDGHPRLNRVGYAAFRANFNPAGFLGLNFSFEGLWPAFFVAPS